MFKQFDCNAFGVLGFFFHYFLGGRGGGTEYNSQVSHFSESMLNGYSKIYCQYIVNPFILCIKTL